MNYLTYRIHITLVFLRGCFPSYDFEVLLSTDIFIYLLITDRLLSKRYSWEIAVLDSHPHPPLTSMKLQTFPHKGPWLLAGLQPMTYLLWAVEGF